MFSLGYTILLAGALVSGQAIHDIRDYGAVGDAETVNSEAIQRAIDACHAAGGGTVLVPEGCFVSGTLRLKSSVRLRLAPGARLRGSGDIGDYTPKHLITADGAEDIVVEGEGCIDGNGPAFWRKHEVSRRTEENAWRYALMWDSYRSESPGHVLSLENCRNVRVEGVRLENSPAWMLSLWACEDIQVKGIQIRNPLWAINTDGLDVVGCRNVRIADCDIRTGDDAICLKSIKARDGGCPVSNVVVTNCVLNSATNAFKLGTDSQTGFENVAFSNSVICSDEEDISLRTISGISLECVDGGTLRNAVISNITMRNVRAPFFIRLGNRGRGQETPMPGTLKNVTLDRIRVQGAFITALLSGLPGHPIEDVSLTNIEIEAEGGGTEGMARREIPELPAAYPEAFMFGRLPAHGLYARHVKGLTVKNYRVSTTRPDERPFLRLDDVMEVRLDDALERTPGVD